MDYSLVLVFAALAALTFALYITELRRRRLAEIALDSAHATTVYRNHAHWEILRELIADEGNSVEVYCDNPEGNPNNAIAVCGAYTDWEAKRVEGFNLFNCLDEARRMMEAHANKA